MKISDINVMSTLFSVTKSLSKTQTQLLRTVPAVPGKWELKGEENEIQIIFHEIVFQLSATDKVKTR